MENNWISVKNKQHPKRDVWCWVLIIPNHINNYSRKTISPAYWDGTWTNGDCWEDYDNEVTHWQVIPKPKFPKKR